MDEFEMKAKKISINVSCEEVRKEWINSKRREKMTERHAAVITEIVGDGNCEKV